MLWVALVAVATTPLTLLPKTFRVQDDVVVRVLVETSTWKTPFDFNWVDDPVRPLLASTTT
jgi:hypothetical protein